MVYINEDWDDMTPAQKQSVRTQRRDAKRQDERLRRGVETKRQGYLTAQRALDAQLDNGA